MAFPTDTLYALGADGLSAKAVNRIFDMKKRPYDMGLPLLLAGVEVLETVAVDIPRVAWALARRFWPGPLTLVLRKAPAIPASVTGGKESVAVRVPDHSVALNLIKKLGRPITGTSANISGDPNPVTAEQVRESLGGTCDLILDGGLVPLGISSTIVDVSGPSPRLIRAGAIPWEAVESIDLASPA